MTLPRYHAIPPLLLPRPLRRGRIPGRQRPSFERDPPATPHPGRWLPHGTHLPFSFRLKSVDPHAPRNDSAKARQSEFAQSLFEPRTFAGLRTVAESKQEAPLLSCESRCISEQAPRCRCESLRIWEGAPTFMWGRSASALRNQPPLYRRALALGTSELAHQVDFLGAVDSRIPSRNYDTIPQQISPRTHVCSSGLQT